MVKELRNFRFVIFGIVICTIIFLIFKSVNNYGSLQIENIKNEYIGEIVDIFSTRKNLSPTFIKIKINNSTYIDLSVSENVIDYSEIGDSVVKLKNDNVITIFNEKKAKSFPFMKISENLRNHDNFPSEWKGRWIISENE
jgi:hypothetical protein